MPGMEKPILDSLTAPILAVDRDLRVRYANAAAGQFWRVRPEHLLDYPIVQLFGQQSPVLAPLLRAIDEEVSTTINPCHFEQGGARPPLNLRVQIDPVQEPNRTVEMALIAFWDQTQRENLESVAQAERMLDSIGTMVRRLAHELQNPLSGIKGATQLLARKVRVLPELREYPTVILKELERLERLVGRLVMQGDGMALAKSPCNLHELLDTVIWFEKNSTDRVRFERLYDPSLPELIGDRDRLHQVFLNLIHNAVEASPPGETVTVRTRMSGPWQSEEPLPEPGRAFFLVDVMDRGPGVTDQARPNLFTPFFTTKKNGTGLGLSISHQIVRAHHGHLRYQPGEGGGAIFSVVLPREEAS